MITGKNPKNSSTSSELRKLAENRLWEKSPEFDLSRPVEDVHRLVHELEVHQIELEMQNEELSQIRDVLDISLEKYTDLFDFAPVGYFTLKHDGKIIFANMKGSSLMGIERSLLFGLSFNQLVTIEDRPLFSKFIENVFTCRDKQSCEFTINNKSESPLSVLIEAAVDSSGKECRMALIDITERKKADKKIVHLASFPLLNPNPVIETDLKGQITYYNPATIRLMSELNIPEDAGYFFPKDFNTIIANFGQGIIDQNYYREVEIEGRFFSENIFISSNLNIVRIYAHEITEQKLAENALKNAHDNLEIVVKERTQELLKTNNALLKEISDHKQAEESLKTAYQEIKQLKNKLLAENIYLQQEVARLDNFGEIIGQSSAISYVFSQIQQVAPINATVLLLGETGTGKGVVACAIHRRSPRKNKPMITVNCTALPGNLIESELFGREKGAFTGATERQMGRFELADGGTIFLDEIGEMPMDLQCKLLRVIQDGEFERLGSPRTIKVDVRIIAATNRNLEEEIRKGKFREDLFYRLNVFPISIPPLSQRTEDIPLLINHFVSKFNKKVGKNIDSVPKETVEMLSQYSWPGNIRELENVIERSVIITNGSVLQVLDRFDISAKKAEQTGQKVKALIELEKDHILKVLQKTGWRIEGKNGAAVILGLNASTLRARMRKYGILRQ